MAAEASAKDSKSEDQAVAATKKEAVRPPPEEEARDLFLQGLDRMREGDREEACFLFKQSLALVPRVTTKFNLADCLEKSGKNAAALLLFSEVATAMQAAGDSARQAAAEERVAALKGQVCRLRVQTDQPVKALVVRKDGDVLPPGSWNTGMPVDSGSYSLEASAPGKESWSAEIQVPVCPSAVSVKVPVLRDSPTTLVKPAKARTAALAEAAQASASAPAQASENLGADRGPSTRGQPFLAYGLAGYGLVSTAVGVVFLSSYQSSNSDAKAICPASTNCTVPQIEAHRGLVADAKAARTKGLIGVSLGGASLAASSVLFLVDFYARSPKHQAHVRAVPMLGMSGVPVAGALLEGSF